MSRMARSLPSRADVQLVAAAKAAAGGPANLAREFRASKQAVSEWGRVRPIPRHLRPRLEDFVRQHMLKGAVRFEYEDRDAPWRALGWLVAATPLKLAPPASKRQASIATNIWRGMGADRQNVLREYVIGAALIAVAAKQIL